MFYLFFIRIFPRKITDLESTGDQSNTFAARGRGGEALIQYRDEQNLFAPCRSPYGRRLLRRFSLIAQRVFAMTYGRAMVLTDAGSCLHGQASRAWASVPLSDETIAAAAAQTCP